MAPLLAESAEVTLGEAVALALAVWLAETLGEEKREGVGRGEEEAESVAQAVVLRVSVGVRETEGQGVALGEALASGEALPVPSATLALGLALVEREKLLEAVAEGEREGRSGEGVAPPLPAEELLAVTRREGEVPGLAVPPPPRLGEDEALPPRGPLPGEALVLALPRALEEALGGALSAALGV